MKIHPLAPELFHADRQTDRHTRKLTVRQASRRRYVTNLTVVFPNYVNASELLFNRYMFRSELAIFRETLCEN